MKKHRWIQWDTVRIAALACIFLLMLILNRNTLYLADDYTYFFSFADGERMHSISQIIPSMIAHASISNGRLIAHSLVQLFAMLPGWVFDLVNAGMFTAQIWLLCRVSAHGRRGNPVFPVLFFALIWMYQPLFGQVNLWQDGSCNYLWGIVLCLAFLMPFAAMFSRGDGTLIQGTWKRLGFLLVAFAAGAYYENTSAAAIFMAMLLTAATALQGRKPVERYTLAVLALACVGYLSIYLAPAQFDNKAAEFSVYVLFQNLIRAVDVYAQFGALLLAYVVMLILCIYQGTDSRRILLSLVFLAGSLAANLIMVFASYYKERTAASAVIYLVAANGICLDSLLRDLRSRPGAVCAMAVALIVCIPQFLPGVKDIRDTYVRMRDNEAYLLACKEQGIRDVCLENVTGTTEQCPAFEIKYLDSSTPEEWPNRDMARYYGVDSITAVEPQ